MPDPSRYHRQELLSGVGPEGQRRLRQSCALIVGCGALGSASADLLCRAGIGRLVLIDRDVVEWTNLQRQTLYDERDAREGAPKAVAAQRRLRNVNSHVDVHALVGDLSPRNADRIIAEHRPDIILDGTDNFETRFLINDAAVKHGIPFVYAGVVAAGGMALPVVPGQTACLRCVFAEPPPAGSQPTCDTAGVLGPAVSIVAGYQAGEAMKILLGLHDRVLRSLLSFDLWLGRRTRIEPQRDPDCRCCVHREFDYLNASDAGTVASLCGQGAVQVSPPRETTIELGKLQEHLAGVGSFRMTEFLVTGTLGEERGEDGEAIGLTVFADGRALVRGVRTPERARAIYARYVGV
ncbi:MAG: thiazole biosynthesis adenylyltransferase ThiF [Leptolyngbya sp. PLA3]|nr:MAG: thiazole biosynthesis adenylyltransferase ThiF [Cyanobacteria bacterium CYA]MCE7969729.1 thiazole biosynthesis adenylyltransferase ThiF [Leptolyngbya sp. PL-A3]